MDYVNLGIDTIYKVKYDNPRADAPIAGVCIVGSAEQSQSFLDWVAANVQLQYFHLAMNSFDDPTLEEQKVLADIYRRTGHSFRHLGGIDPNDRELIASILPIAREWIPFVGSGVKRALYGLFLTRSAAPYLDDVLIWASSASDRLDRDLFAQILNGLITSKTAEKIWHSFQKLQPSDFDPLLLATFARTRKTSELAVPRIVNDLRSAAERINRGERIRSLNTAAFREYSRLRHPRIREWFREYVNSSDPDLRKFALRAAGPPRPPALPTSCHIIAGSPDLKNEIFSTEVEADKVSSSLTTIFGTYGARCDVTSAGRILDNLTRERWIVMEVQESDRGPLEVWFREEDEDTIEIRVVVAKTLRLS